MSLVTLFSIACGGDDDDSDVDGGGTSADASSAAQDAARPDDEPDAAEPSDAGDPSDAAPESGSATLRGQVGGETIEPAGAIYTLHPQAEDFVLVMPEGKVSCDVEEDSDAPNAVIGFPCGPAEATTYPVNQDPKATCDPRAPHVWVLVEEIDGGFEFLAASGSVTVEASDDSSVSGSFTADFGPDGSLTGSFDAAACAE
jgi:hypothetical protein